MRVIVLTVQCPSRRGIVAAVSTFLAESGCNIIDSAQFDDADTGRFFMRVAFASEKGVPFEALKNGFRRTAQDLDIEFGMHEDSENLKAIIMVSRFDHCLNDLMYRWRIGTLPIDLVGVVSNHTQSREAVLAHGLSFHHIAVTRKTKAQAELELLEIVERTGAELIVLARYMQVLSEDICRRMPGRIINIHHSFLPSFKGARPYQQAYARGVKLIGATAHYVTTELDEGPIIEQDIVRVTHAQSPGDYVALGRDVEAIVLARAVHAHAHRRVFMNGAKTVVFPPSPNSYAANGTARAG